MNRFGLIRILPAVGLGCALGAELLLIIYVTSRWKYLCVLSAVEGTALVGHEFVKDLLWSFYMVTAVLAVITFGAFLARLRPLLGRWREREKMEKGQEEEVRFQDLHVDLQNNTLEYADMVMKLQPRVVRVLHALMHKEDHVLTMDDFNRLFGDNYYDGTDSSGAKVRSIRSSTRKALAETPYDVERDADGNFRLTVRK